MTPAGWCIGATPPAPGRMMVKETEDETDQTLHIMFDSGDVRGEGRDTNFEYAIKLAATVADYALKNGVPIRVWGSHLSGAGVAAAGSAQQPLGVTLTWPELLQSLAVALPTNRVAVREGLASLPIGANLFVVVSEGDETSHESLRRAVSRSGESIVVRLDGFGDSVGNGDTDHSLDLAGVQVITCKPGGIDQTIAAIEAVGRSQAPVASIESDAKVSAGSGSL